jgi:hypothetical protein
LAAGLILKRLLLIQLFDLRRKINARLASAALRLPFYLAGHSQTNKDNGNTAHVNKLALSDRTFVPSKAAPLLC